MVSACSPSAALSSSLSPQPAVLPLQHRAAAPFSDGPGGSRGLISNMGCCKYCRLTCIRSDWCENCARFLDAQSPDSSDSGTLVGPAEITMSDGEDGEDWPPADDPSAAASSSMSLQPAVPPLQYRAAASSGSDVVFPSAQEPAVSSQSSSECNSDDSWYNDDHGAMERGTWCPEAFRHEPRPQRHFGQMDMRYGPERTRPPLRGVGPDFVPPPATTFGETVAPETHVPKSAPPSLPLRLVDPEQEVPGGSWECHDCRSQNCSSRCWCRICGVERLA